MPMKAKKPLVEKQEQVLFLDFGPFPWSLIWIRILIPNTDQGLPNEFKSVRIGSTALVRGCTLRFNCENTHPWISGSEFRPVNRCYGSADLDPVPSIAAKCSTGTTKNYKGGRARMSCFCFVENQVKCRLTSMRKRRQKFLVSDPDTNLDPDSIGSVDPDQNPYSESGSGSRRAKWPTKEGKK